jgi:4'-phosphopantetheinyl transferase EntD
MIEHEIEKYFRNSKVFFINKNSIDSSDIQNLAAKIKFSEEINKFHPDRKKEYILGRICAHQLLKNNFNLEILEFPTDEKSRAPIWPRGFVGSISHDKDYVLCALSNSLDCLGVDIENLGRVKEDFKRHILIPQDSLDIDGISRSDAMTIIFSAKEALYKALYPKVNKFFGFDSAYVSEIDLETNTFKINLIKELSSEYGPLQLSEFTGSFFLNHERCLTVIEILRY